VLTDLGQRDLELLQDGQQPLHLPELAGQPLHRAGDLAGVEGVVFRGRAEAGDKTMVDALLPARDALRAAAKDGVELAAGLAAAAAAAEEGMRATTPMVAKKGRASYLGDRSAGNQDPGATSAYLLLKAAADVWG